jgi:hypothetical protein
LVLLRLEKSASIRHSAECILAFNSLNTCPEFWEQWAITVSMYPIVLLIVWKVYSLILHQWVSNGRAYGFKKRFHFSDNNLASLKSETLTIIRLQRFPVSQGYFTAFTKSVCDGLHFKVSLHIVNINRSLELFSFKGRVDILWQDIWLHDLPGAPGCWQYQVREYQNQGESFALFSE